MKNRCDISGFADKRDARKYARALLRAGYIRNTVDKLSFSEQCYYVFSPHIIVQASNLPDLKSLTSFSSVGRFSIANKQCMPCLPAPGDQQERTLIMNSTMKTHESGFDQYRTGSIISRSNLCEIFADHRRISQDSTSPNSTITTSTAAKQPLKDKDHTGFLTINRRQAEKEFYADQLKKQRADRQDFSRLDHKMSKCTIDNSERSNDVFM
ncbi:hypothetical protein ACOME3_000610 [Neoechinorhynchus agilis]